VSVAIGIELADLGSIGGAEAREMGIRMIARFNVALASLLLTGLLVLGPSIVGIWTGRFELGSIPILIWLLLPVVVMAPAIPLQMLTLYGSRPKPQATAAFVQLLIAIPLCAVAGHLYGVVGVAAGVGIGEAVAMGAVLPAIASRGLRVGYPRLLAECAALFVPAAAWSAAVGWLLTRAIVTTHVGGLVIVLAFWAALAAGPVLLVSVPPAMRRRLLEFLRVKAYGRTR